METLFTPTKWPITLMVQIYFEGYGRRDQVNLQRDSGTRRAQMNQLLCAYSFSRWTRIRRHVCITYNFKERVQMKHSTTLRSMVWLKKADYTWTILGTSMLKQSDAAVIGSGRLRITILQISMVRRPTLQPDAKLYCWGNHSWRLNSWLKMMWSLSGEQKAKYGRNGYSVSAFFSPIY